MSELKFNSQVCTTREQSQRLLNLGLKPETADMCHHLSNPQDAESPYTRLVLEDYIYIHLGEEGWEDAAPAWSLHRLLSIGINGDYMGLWNININTDTVGDLFEQLIKLIEWAIKDGTFNKEYLKQ